MLGDLEKKADEIDEIDETNKEIPEPIIEIAKIIDPKLEKKYEVYGEENWLLITKKEKNMIIKGGITFNIENYSATYSITIARKTNDEEYQAAYELGTTQGGLTSFLKAFEETLKMIKNLKNKK